MADGERLGDAGTCGIDGAQQLPAENAGRDNGASGGDQAAGYGSVTAEDDCGYGGDEGMSLKFKARAENRHTRKDRKAFVYVCGLRFDDRYFFLAPFWGDLIKGKGGPLRVVRKGLVWMVNRNNNNAVLLPV